MLVKPSVCDCDLHIKYFLSCFVAFDKAMRKSSDVPSWITSYNYVCLTNIPQMISDFGPLRNLWEGGGQGGKIVGLLRPLCCGYRYNWYINLLENI